MKKLVLAGCLFAATSFADIKSKQKQQTGCLAEDASRRGKAPWFGFADPQPPGRNIGGASLVVEFW